MKWNRFFYLPLSTLYFALIAGCGLPAGLVPLPPSLRDLPQIDNAGILLASKTVKIKEAPNAFNGSLTRDPDSANYLLVTRYDESSIFGWICPNRFLGVVGLNADFEEIPGSFAKLKNRSQMAQDPTAIVTGNDIFFTHDDNAPFSTIRAVYGALLAKPYNSGDLINRRRYKGPIKGRIEKSWIPFIYTPPGGTPEVMLLYSSSPMVVYQENQIAAGNTKPFSVCKQKLSWPHGRIRGGSPALLIDNEYLAFFHSSFSSGGAYWYVMGAYTFESKPPFCAIKISQHPILFSSLYDTPLSELAPPDRRVIFPRGLVFEERNGKKLLQVSAGVNDSAVKIFTFDYEKFMSTLIKISAPQ